MRPFRFCLLVGLAAMLSAAGPLGAQSGSVPHHVDPPGTPAHTHPAPAAPAPHVHPVTPRAASNEHETTASEVVAGAASQGHDHAAVVASDHAEAHNHGDAPSVPDRWFVRLLLGATLSFAALLFVLGHRRAAARTPSRSGKDLLAVPLLGALLRWRHFNRLLLAPTLLFFGIVVGAGLFGEQTTNNPAILLTWILWWPAVIFTFVLVGRIWCAICPFGYVGDLAQRIATLGRKPPRLLRNMWWRLGLFLLLTWFTALFALDRTPRSTAWLALALTIGAVALAVGVREARVLPIRVSGRRHLRAVLDDGAARAVSARDSEVCRTECRTKDCAAACTWFQFPSHMDRGAECSLCLDCVRACPHDNLALRTQPIGERAWRGSGRTVQSLDEATTVAAILGVALLQTVVMLNAWDGVAGWRPCCTYHRDRCLPSSSASGSCRSLCWPCCRC